MIIEVGKGHLRIQLGSRNVRILGEMFFPGNNNLGFTVFSDLLINKHWEPPYEKQMLTINDVKIILDIARTEFQSEGHIFEIE